MAPELKCGGNAVNAVVVGRPEYLIEQTDTDVQHVGIKRKAMMSRNKIQGPRLTARLTAF